MPGRHLQDADVRKVQVSRRRVFASSPSSRRYSEASIRLQIVSPRFASGARLRVCRVLGKFVWATASPTLTPRSHEKDKCTRPICDFCGKANHVRANCFQLRCCTCDGNGHSGKAEDNEVCTVPQAQWYCRYCKRGGHNIHDCFRLQQKVRETEPPCSECGDDHGYIECPYMVHNRGGGRGRVAARQ